MQGEGTSQNYKKAREYFEQSAEAGNVEAQYMLGVMYEYGENTEQNYQKAIQLYRKAARHGYVKAQYVLGNMYKNGKGVKKDLSRAIRWYQTAADKGETNAQYQLGIIYLEGNDRNVTKGTELIKKSGKYSCLVFSWKSLSGREIYYKKSEIGSTMF